MAMSKFNIIKNVVFALLLLAGVAWYMVNFTWAESRVKDLCRQIQPGMSLDALKAFGLQHGLGPQPTKAFGIVFMGERKTNGRYGCKIFLEAGVVKTAEYNSGQ